MATLDGGGLDAAVLDAAVLDAAVLDAAAVDGGFAADGGLDAAGLDSGRTDASTPDLHAVDECRRLAEALRSSCHEPNGECEYSIVHALCDKEDTDALVEGLQCLRDGSVGEGTCLLFAAPSGARDCVRAALSSRVDPTEQSIADRMADLCPLSSDDLLFESAIPMSALAPATAARLDTCTAAATSCGEAVTCLRSMYDEFGALGDPSVCRE